MKDGFCIVLSEGFKDVPVRISIDRVLVYSSSAVSTKLLTGMAEFVKVDEKLASKRPMAVVVSINDIQTTFSVESEKMQCITVSMEGSEVVHKLTEKPLGYA